MTEDSIPHRLEIFHAQLTKISFYSQSIANKIFSQDPSDYLPRYELSSDSKKSSGGLINVKIDD